MSKQTDILIIGAGPAGLAAACAACSCGLEVMVVDEQPAPGGQLFRRIETAEARRFLTPEDRASGDDLLERFRASGALYMPEATVWGLEPHKVFCTLDGKAQTLRSSTMVIASGAMERPVPFPGWTLPGVLSAGGAEILLRSGGSLTQDPDRPVVLAGNGPLLVLLASHLLKEGVTIAAWLDTGTWSKRLRALGALPESLGDPAYLWRGIHTAWEMVRSHVPLISGVRGLMAHGRDGVERVSYSVEGQAHELEASTLLYHEGIIPRTHIATSLHVDCGWEPVQRYWYPLTDDYGATNIDGVYVVGDGAYVHGGDASMLKGTLAGLAVARRLGVIGEDELQYRAKDTHRKLRMLKRSRSWLRHLFAPHPAIFDIPDDTIVCRCECVTAGAIRQAAAEGYAEVNEIKRMTRCGMGLCQGRMCGPSLIELTAAALGVAPQTVGRLRIRQPFRPVPLCEYCSASLSSE